MKTMLRFGMPSAVLFAVLSMSLAAEGPVLKAPAPTPVKPAQPATMPATTVPAQPAAKSPVTPITPITGKKPGTGPAARIGVIKALVSTLRVNNSPGPVTVGLSGTAMVSWDLSSVPNASGVHLLVHTSTLESINCTAPLATASPDSDKYTTSPRALTLTNAYYRDRQTYYIKGCVFTRTTDPFGQVTDSYTGDWTNQVVLRLDGRPDYSVRDARVNVESPFYMVGPGWREKNWDTITSFPQRLPFYPAYTAVVLSNTADAVRVTLILNGNKYRVNLDGQRLNRDMSFNDVPVNNLWRDYQQSPRMVLGVVYVDEEGSVEESNEWNNFQLTRLQIWDVRPTDLRVTRGGAGLQLMWQPSTVNTGVDGYHIAVRYTLGPTGPVSGGVITQRVQRVFTVSGPSRSSILTISTLPWGEMVDNRACFRVVAYKNSGTSAYELVSEPSNEVCYAVRDRRN